MVEPLAFPLEHLQEVRGLEKIALALARGVHRFAAAGHLFVLRITLVIRQSELLDLRGSRGFVG